MNIWRGNAKTYLGRPKLHEEELRNNCKTTEKSLGPTFLAAEWESAVQKQELRVG